VHQPEEDLLQGALHGDELEQPVAGAHDAVGDRRCHVGVVDDQGDAAAVDGLDPAVAGEGVKQRLVDSGFGLAARIPEVNASFVLFDVKNLTRARSAFNLLNTLGIWLPIIAIVLLGVGVAVATDHRRALLGAAVGVAVAMVGLGLSLAVFRTLYLDAVPPAVLPHDAAAVLYDTIVAYLRLGLRTILVLALVVAAGALVTGQSATAVRTRQRLTAGIGWLRGGADHAGWRTGPVGTWVYANKQLLRIAAVTLAALALVFWDQPTGKTILLLAGLLLVALALIEFLAQPPQPTVIAPPTQT